MKPKSLLKVIPVITLVLLILVYKSDWCSTQLLVWSLGTVGGYGSQQYRAGIIVLLIQSATIANIVHFVSKFIICQLDKEFCNRVRNLDGRKR